MPAEAYAASASDDAARAYQQATTGSPAGANERTAWQRPEEAAVSGSATATPVGAAGGPGAAGTPSGGDGEPVTRIQSEQPVYPGYVAGQAGPYAVPPTGQAWTPPASNPKKVPTAVKFVAGGVAAVLLALCSGVTGAVLATAIADKGSFSLPVSTDTAPIVDRSTLSGVAAKTQPSVVNIASGQGEGSGVILTEDGYILTNNHVVESASGGTVTVTLSNGKKVKAKVVGTDPRTDLAVIKADATGLTKATLGDSNRVAVGDTVLAIGSPLGLQGSVTSGIISAKDRTIQAGQTSTSLSGLLQTDAPINPGNSGGALVNTNGDVIGINTAIATSGNGEGNIGVGFAIPSNKAKQVAEQLINGQKVSHPFLGVSVTAEETGGAKIGTISPNSPAAAAGLKEGDVITKFGDRVVNDSDDLVSAVQSGTVGQKVTVEFSRNGETQTATVTLGEAS
ncbi:MAG TPA: peptidase S1 [Micromonosporaceae bacterium]|nr:peptidase S1 [Micromonosporaceae bacterium]